MFSALLSLNPPPYPFVLRFAIESPPDFLHPLKRAGELCNMHVFCEGGGVAERTHMRYRKAYGFFSGTCRSSVPPMNAAFEALNGTCRSSVPPMNAAFGTLNGTCRSNVPPMNAAFEALNGTCRSNVPPMNARLWSVKWDVREQRPSGF